MITLQAIADHGDAQPDGAIIGSFGGSDLIREIGCVRSSFWLHVNRLERVGYLVCLSRGGVVRVRTGSRVRNLANVYGIPARRGGLDDRAVARLWVTLPKLAGGGRGRVVHCQGGQATFWAGSSGSEVGLPPSESRTRVVRNSDTPIPYSIPSKNHGHDHGVSGENVRGKSRQRIPHTTVEDLRSGVRLFGLYDRCVKLGAVPETEASRLEFVAAAEHALRVATTNPPGLFATLVANPKQRAEFLSCEDEARASRRINSWLSGEQT